MIDILMMIDDDVIDDDVIDDDDCLDTCFCLLQVMIKSIVSYTLVEMLSPMTYMFEFITICY